MRGAAYLSKSPDGVYYARFVVPVQQMLPGTSREFRLSTRTKDPKAARAVGLAVGANPVALMIPCHRVIQQNGKLGGYHWGETRKQAIHAWEAARYE